MARRIISPARRIATAPGGLLSLELDLPEISIELPTPAQMARSTAALVAERLRESIKGGKDAEGRGLRAPSAATLLRRAADKYPPLRPRSNRWINRYPGRVAAMLGGSLTPGRIKSRTTRWQGARSGYKRTTRFKSLSVSQLAAVDSGTLWSRIRLAAAGAGSAEVHAPPERPMADIERRLGAKIFAATSRMLEDATDAILAPVFSGWSGGPAAGAQAAVRKAVS